MTSVRLPAKYAQLARKLLLNNHLVHPASPLLRALDAALAPASAKKRAARNSARQSRATRRSSKRDETSTIYQAVEQRADGRCEGCGAPFSSSDPPEMDHFFGRGKVHQAVSNCWLLHRSCHGRKTGNRPSATFWLTSFIVHAQKQGYAAEAKRAGDRLEAIVAEDDAPTPAATPEKASGA